MRIRRFCFLCYALIITGVLFSCSKDNNSSEETLNSQLRLEITDAPIDDTNVKGAFVTIADVKLDGQSVEGFNRTTIDLLAYQNGDTKLLTDSEVAAGTYNQLSLVLDYDQDENGDSPGCYIADKDGNSKHALASAESEIVLNKQLELEENMESDYVLDFDLRKCIRREDGSDQDYAFVSEAEMKSGIRLVSKKNTGTIRGNCSDFLSGSDKVVVYAYKKGSYNRNNEIEGQGESNIEFSNAISSSAIDSDGNYELHYLEEGAYELHYCSYRQKNDGSMELKGTLIVDVLGSLDLESIELSSNTSVTVNVSVTGLLVI